MKLFTSGAFVHITFYILIIFQGQSPRPRSLQMQKLDDDLFGDEGYQDGKHSTRYLQYIS
jgi:hypothetical protein